MIVLGSYGAWHNMCLHLHSLMDFLNFHVYAARSLSLNHSVIRRLHIPPTSDFDCWCSFGVQVYRAVVVVLWSARILSRKKNEWEREKLVTSYGYQQMPKLSSYAMSIIVSSLNRLPAGLNQKSNQPLWTNSKFPNENWISRDHLWWQHKHFF